MPGPPVSDTETVAPAATDVGAVKTGVDGVDPVTVVVLLVVLFWLCLLFISFGLFAPTNATVTVVLFLCAVAVAGAIQTILDLSRPFEGVVRVSVEPLRHALDVINHG